MKYDTWHAGDLKAAPSLGSEPSIPLSLASTINCALATIMNAAETALALKDALQRTSKKGPIAIIVSY